MSITVHFTPAGMTAGQYDEIIRRLEAAGQGTPAGREHHVCFGPADGLEVVDVFESMEAFESFGRTLLPILQEVGVDPGQPAIAEVHNLILPERSRSSA